MTVDGFAYHYHHPHHHPHHHHPHQSPVHQQETFLFFSIFHFPFPFFLCFTFFFHLGELGQPNHVQFRVTVTVMTVIFYFSCIFPVVVQGSGKTKKASRAEKKKSQIFVQFPVVIIHHILYTRVGMSTERKNTAGAIIAHFWVGG